MMEKLNRNEVAEMFALTPVQAGMLFHYLQDPQGDIYFEQLCLEITGPLDLDMCERAWNEVVAANEMLRTVFRWQGVPEPVQVVLKEADFKPRYFDLTPPVPSLEEIRARDRQERFDLEQVPFRVTVCKTAEHGWAMIVSHHHILYDGWSSGIILKEFFTAYRALAEGRQLTRSPKSGFKEFVRWLRQRDTDNDRVFWQDYLRDLDIPPVAAARGREPAAVTDTAVWRQRLLAETSRQLRSFAEGHRFTLSALIYGAWGVVLQRYHDRHDIVCDTTVSGRSAEVKGIEDMVGLFINTVPFRLKAAAPETVAGLIARIDGELRQRQSFENSLPLDIKEHLEVYNRGLLFSSLLVVENYPLDKELKQYGDLTVFEQTGYDLTAVITAFDGDIELHLTYNRQLFDPKSAAALSGHFVRVLQSMVEKPGGRVGDIDIAAAGERAKILHNSGSIVRSRHEYRPPRDDVEEKLAGIWASLLKVEGECIGPDSSFFEFGGHSLKAGLLTVRIFKEFGLKVPPAEVFRRPTLAELAGYIKIQMGKGAAAETAAVPAAEKREYYDLSLAQQRLYVQQKLSPGTTILNMPVLLHLGGEIDRDRLAKTFKKLIERHESLRTSFMEVAGTPVQRVHPPRDIGERGFEIGDVTGPALFVRPFDLSRPPLLRVGIIRQPPGLLVDVHHLVSDGASQQFLAREFTALYTGKDLPRPRLQYKDFTLWQHRQVHTEEMRVHEQYWRHRLRAPLPKVDLPLDFPAPAGQDFAGDTLRTTLGRDLSRRLTVFLGQTGTTLYMVLLTVFNVLLNRYGGQQDIVIGSPTAGRSHPELEPVVGLLMGTIMMRHFPQEGKTFLGFLEEVRQGTLEAYEHQVYPYEELARRPDRGDWHPITTLGLNVQNMFDPASLSEGGLLSLEWGAYVPDTSKLDLTVTAVEWQQDVLLEFEYRTALFKPETVARLAARFLQVLREAVENPGLHLWEIDMIPGAEKRALIGSPERCYPLTHAQKRIYYTEQTYPGSSCNALVFTVRCGKILDKARLAAAIHTVISRHEGLQLRIVKFPSTVEPCQYVAPLPGLALDELDFPAEGGPPFALTNAPLFYFAYVRFNRQESGYLVKLHHLVADGWTTLLLFEEIDRVYRQLEVGEPVDRTPAPSYVQYIREEKAYLHSPQARQDREFWHRNLLPLPPEASLSGRSPRRDASPDCRGQAALLPFPEALRNRLHRYRRQHKTSLFKLILAGLAVYISRASGGDDIVIGSASHNRSTSEHGKMMGMFVSTIPLRLAVAGELAFADFVEQCGRRLNRIIKNHQKYPFDVLMDEIRESTRQDPRYLLEVNLIGHGDLEEERFTVCHHFAGDEPTPLSIHINTGNRDTRGVLELEWDYQPAHFSAEEIHRLHQGLINILTDALEEPHKHIAHIELLAPQERARLLFDFNDTQRAYNLDQTFHELVARQAAKTPGRPAVMAAAATGGTGLTYRELDQRANRLARRLRERGISRGSIAAIMVDRTPEIALGVLGILKAGAAFLPLDPVYPAARLHYMLADSRASILLTQTHLAGALKGAGSLEVVNLDDYREQEGVGPPPEAVNSAADPVYVIYTSGSTGQPKGVVVQHHSFVNAAFGWQEEYRLREMEVNLLQMASFSFDVFCGDLARTWLNGGKLVICPGDIRLDPASLYALITSQDYGITIFESTPALVVPFMDYVYDNQLPLQGLKLLILGSEVCRRQDYRRLLERFGSRMRIVNSYGVTEATIDSGYYEEAVSHAALAGVGSVPIGKPLPNTTLYILSPGLRLQPVGLAGELYIGGAGVSRGYLNNPELTAQKFVTAPATSPSHQPLNPKSQILYRTGDLCRFLPDGNIEFLGRLDHQVKIRGFRIELGEIESQLSSHPLVKEAVVLAREDADQDKTLTAYIVPQAIRTNRTNRTSRTNETSPLNLRQYLAETLPDYMLPTFFVSLAKMPLTPGGKVDRRALPEPVVVPKGGYVAPRDDVERRLTEIWAELLNIDSQAIGIQAHFFHLGGHSLKAVNLAARIAREWQIEVPLTRIFARPTVEGLAEYINGAVAEQYRSIGAAEKKEYYVLSSAQKRLYVLQQWDSGSIGYNVPVAVTLTGSLDGEKWAQVWPELIRRHESLRTAFILVNGEPVQQIHDEVDFSIEYPQAGTGQYFDLPALISTFIRPFVLSRPPLFRLGLVPLKRAEHLLVMDMHHIIADGTSLNILVKDFMALYGGGALPLLKVQYKDYAEWCNSRKGKGHLKIEARQRYWQQQLSGELPVLNLPTDYPRPPLQSLEGNTLRFEIGPVDTAALKTLTLQADSTLYMVLFSVYSIWLSKLCGQAEIVVGTPVACRRHADIEAVVGMFVNTLVLRSQPAADKTFTGFLSEVTGRTLTAFENQEYPFADLVEEVSTDRDPSRNPLFDVMFVLQNLGLPPIEAAGLGLKPRDIDTGVAKFDLTLIAVEEAGRVRLALEYSGKLFKAETVLRFIACFKEVLSSVIQEPLKRIAEIAIIPEEEKYRVLHEFNRRVTDFPPGQTVHGLFAEQVERRPDKTAVVGTGQVTYRELNRRADRLAGVLADRGVQADTVAGVLLARSPELIIGLLAVLKAGGAYLPLDPAYPVHRLRFMLADSGAPVVVAPEYLAGRLGLNNAIDPGADQPHAPAESRPQPRGSGDNLLYLIYTSGSIGRPKGVLIRHRGFINLVFFHRQVFGGGADARMSQVAAPGFDAMAFEVWPCLLDGACLYIADDDTRLEPIRLKQWLIDRGITVSFQPTVMTEHLLDQPWPAYGVALESLRAAGDRLSRYPGPALPFTLYNLYGPTEDTVWTTWREVGARAEGEGEGAEKAPDIGRPVANHRVYIMDPNLKLQPIGVAGELCIGGEGLAAGYLNRPELTAEKFVNLAAKIREDTRIPTSSHFTVSTDSPLERGAPEGRGVLYRTGDLARFLPDGNIEFLGRLDHQVKIRGFRIELGEIESQLLRHPAVREAVVVAREEAGRDKYLTAYFVSQPAADTDLALRPYLAHRLPDYMIPAYFVRLDKLPLTPNGKLDRRALPVPQPATGPAYEAPTDIIEERLVEIWQQVLGVDRVGINHNFFELGGDSIKGIQVSAQLQPFGLKLSIRDLFLKPTIKELRRCLQVKEVAVDRGVVEGEVALTPIQGWLFENDFNLCRHFNQAVMLYRQEGFAPEVVERVFRKIVEHHDALRMVYGLRGDRVIQTNRGLGQGLFHLHRLNVKGPGDVESRLEEEANRLQRGIDLERGPLVHLGLFETDQGDHLLIVIHHLVVDGVSWRILLEDFKKGYVQALQGEEIEFWPRTDSFRQWSRQLGEYAGGEALLSELAFWRSIEEAEIPPLARDFEIPDSRRTVAHSDTVELRVDERETGRLLREVNRAYGTDINDLLLAALGLTVKAWGGTDKVLIQLEGHGRQELMGDIDISRTVGWFTSQFPLLLDMGPSGNLSYVIKSVKETLRRLPHRGIGYGILRYLTPADKRQGIALRLEPEIRFNYLGQFDVGGGGEPFQLSELKVGDLINPALERRSLWDINGMIVGGELVLSFSYNRHEYKRTTAERWAGLYKSNLLKIIEHCLAKEKREPTPSDLTYADFSIAELEQLSRRLGDLVDIYELTPMQSGMLFHALKADNPEAYFEQTVITLKGDIEAALLQEGLDTLIQRYEVLRTLFLYEKVDRPLQVVLGRRACRLHVEGIAHLAEGEKKAFLQAFCRQDRQRGFDLSRDMLTRLSLINTGERQYRLLWSFHHILLDGWCLGILFKELLYIYRGLKKGESLKGEAVNQYSSYIKWLREQDREAGLKYWQHYLEGCEEPTVVPRLAGSPPAGQYVLEEYRYTVDPVLTDRLKGIASQYRVTMSTLMQTVWGLLLQVTNNTDDVVYGAVVSGRPAEVQGIERMVGLFINTVPVRIKADGGWVFWQLLRQMQLDALSSKAYEYLPLADIQARSFLKGDLIDHIMIFENYPLERELKDRSLASACGLEVVEIEAFEQTNYNFNIAVAADDCLTVTFSYNGLCRDRDFVRGIAAHLERVLGQVAQNPHLCLRDIDILTEPERERIVFGFNETESPYPQELTVHQLFARRVEQAADRTALVESAPAASRGRQLTYGELNEGADRLSHSLRAEGLRPGTIVALLLGRCLEMVIGIFGILKAGGAYLPIEPDYPEEQIRFMLADSGAGTVLTGHSLTRLSRLQPSPLHRSPVHPTPTTSLAYVIYTSGSTGRPKGVLVSHRNLVAYLSAFDSEFHVTHRDTILQQASYAFDTSGEEVYPILLKGGRLVLAQRREVMDADVLVDLIWRHWITILDCSPLLLGVLNRHPLPGSVHLLISGGDVLRRDHIDRLLESGKVVYNTYGPTETTICAAYYRCPPEGTLDVPIGKPIANYRLYILDRRHRPLPIGTAGELCIAGPGVSRGYLNHPELTADKFLNLAAKTREDTRIPTSSHFTVPMDSPLERGAPKGRGVLYRTGDRCRWLPDGTIEFLGRLDFQVKIRGYRIEPAEIEAQLRRHQDILDAAVIDRRDESGDRYLTAYFIPKTSRTNPTSPAKFRHYLAGILPDYMIPAFFVLLEELPLTPGGKLDRKALPEPLIRPGDRYVPPAGDLERKLLEIWSGVLGIDKDVLGSSANFFHLGGHSLKATILTSRIHKELAVKVPLTEVFKRPTVRGLAAYIRQARQEKYAGIKAVEKREYYALSSAQKRLYFLQQMEPDSTVYNMPLVLSVRDMAGDGIESALKQLIVRHESLRTSFARLDDVPVQRVHEGVDFRMEYAKGAAGAVKSFIRPFDLAVAPLIRSGLIRLPEGGLIWMLDIHHIVSDGTSHTVLAEDFKALRRGEALAGLRLHYKDFAAWQNRLFDSDEIAAQQEYWLKLYADSRQVPRLQLPTDYKRPEVFTFGGASYEWLLDREDAAGFKALAVRYGATLYMNILAALNTLFYKYTGQTDIIIGTGIAGRPHADLQSIIGMFVNTLAMRNYPQGDKAYDAFLQEVIGHSVAAFENQDVQFEELVDRLDLERDPGRNPLFDISMVVQNFRSAEPGLDENWRPAAYEHTTSKFDMTFFVFESADDVGIIVEYYTAIFKPETIRRLVSHFGNIIQAVVAAPGLRLREIDILSAGERRQVLAEFNDTLREYPAQRTIPELFENQAEKTPDSLAVVHEESHLTYKELSQRADRLAGYLYGEKGIRPGQTEIVGLWLSPSLARPISILGVLKAGGAYIPIDPSLPPRRIKYMIADASLGVVVSEKRYVRELNRLQWECCSFHTYVCLDSLDIHGEEESERNELMDEELWRHVGESASDDITGGGWISSYTGKPLSPAEMEEYADNIFEKLKPLLRPQMRVLEIGCASGLSMYRLAPAVGLYYGTDLSPVIVEKNRERVRQQGYRNIKLACLAAHQLERLEADRFDLVIMNSVIQCFHGHNYLRRVIRRCIDLLAEKGRLFIGDIMDQDKKDALIRELFAFKNANRGMGYTTKTDFSSELFVARGFWNDLAAEFPEIEAVAFSGKRYTIENELTGFRYDTLITINKEGLCALASTGGRRTKTKHQDDLTTLSAYGGGPLRLNIPAGSPAYIIYTSGTSGKPKGVLITHQSLVNLCYWHNRCYDVTASDQATLYAGFGFDASVWELFPYLLKGAALHIIGDTLKLDFEALALYYQNNHITIGFLPTQFCQQFMEEVGDIPSLRVLLSGGEKLNRFTRRSYRLTNNYGPTENTVVTTAFAVEEQLDNIPIGKPIDNVQVYILDGENLRLQPPGVAGELCITGDGISRGYLNNPQLTAERFVILAAKGREGTRSSNISLFQHSIIPEFKRSGILYRTGDLARFRADGNIEFLGRLDHQVKIRGFRIEPAEIEIQLLKHDNVREAVVIERGGNLCAYVVPVDTMGADEASLGSELGAYLARTLPDYMIPAHFVPLAAIPLTPGGKVERNRLPEPGVVPAERYAPPGDSVEEALVTIWAEVLTSDSPAPIGIDDNFFERGGHSLKATILTSRIHKELEVKVPLAEIFRRQTIRQLAAYVRQAGEKRYIGIEPVEEREYYPLSSAQARLYFLARFDTIGTSYSMPSVLEIEGAPDIEHLTAVFQQLIRRHQVLRTAFHTLDGEPVQKIEPAVHFEIETRRLPAPDSQLSTVISNFVRPFDLSHAPLLRVALAALPGGGRFLLFDMHHIIADGTAMAILVKEFFALYDCQTLPRLRIQYKDYARWQNRNMTSGKIREQEAYWLNLYSGGIPRLALATDYPRPEVFTFEGDVLEFDLDSRVSAAFKEMCTSRNLTLYMGLMAVYNVLLYKYTGQEDIIVGSGIAGRNHHDLKGLLGLFVNMLALRNQPGGEKTVEKFVGEVRENALLAFANQDMQFEDLVGRLDLPRLPAHNPLFDVCFVVQNFEQPELHSRHITFRPYRFKNTTAKFDITLFAQESGGEIHFVLEYCTSLFKAETIRRLQGHFLNILGQLARSPRQPMTTTIGKLDILSEAEKRRLLVDFTATAADFPGDKTVHRLIEEQARRTPDRLALTGPGQSTGTACPACQITYRQLMARANRIGRCLHHGHLLRPGDLVGLLMDSSLELVVAILGVLKAGAAYLPMEPSLPEERLRHIVDDAGMVLILSQKRFLRVLNRLLWECRRFHTYLCLDSRDIQAEPEVEKSSLMDRELWEYVGQRAGDDIEAGGWLSSYTGESLSAAEMAEYGDNALRKLRPLLLPRMRVLEIGCASGLTMYRLAPHVGYYLGTDLSEVIIRKNRQRVEQQGRRNIALRCLPAHEIGVLKEQAEPFDLIIMNSVIQTFHGHNYLRQVIQQAIDLLAAGGYLFIGDIMDQELKSQMIRDLLAFQRAHRGQDTGYRTKTDFSEELFVSRRFFEDLMADMPPIREATFSAKIHTIENELTRFRYDALLRIGQGSDKNGERPREGRRKHRYQEDLRALESFGADPLPAVSAPGDPAYCIYTSGSTGRPKGVLVDHRSLVNLCWWHNRHFAVTSGDRASKYAGLGFDASVWEIFPYLVAGSALYVVDEEIRLEVERLRHYFDVHRITISFLPTQVCEQFMLLTSTPASLRLLLTGGDKLQRHAKQGYRLVNNYGPTENTVVTTSYRVDDDTPPLNIPIGKPVCNTRVYILDRQQQPQPLGVPGELCISGIGLARGYLNRPELTAERFVDLAAKTREDTRSSNIPLFQHSIIPGFNRSGKLYRTGDVARWRPDGHIEFLGRVDEQVKIRGYRIEPGEVESLLLGRDDIEAAAVVPHTRLQTGDRSLCAYFVPAARGSGDPPTAEELKAYLARTLPDYMIPLYFVKIAHLPLTPNGKLDRGALPPPESGHEGYAAPANDIERRLVEIWQEVLGLNRVGVNDNFFAVGGDSIKAIQVTARLRKYGMDLRISDLFLHPTVSESAACVKEICSQDRPAEIEESGLKPEELAAFEKEFSAID
jgi:amino acid adenylation domain-containing protein/non-ribosomal peptide synthase protein (TIGR01720 family)